MLWRQDPNAVHVVEELWLGRMNPRAALHQKVADCLPSSDRQLYHFFEALFSQDDQMGKVMEDVKGPLDDKGFSCVEDAVRAVVKIIQTKEGSRHAKGVNPSYPQKCA
jgi:hypothetical protein